MARKLTKRDRVNAEASRISQLTNAHDAHFKVILSHQIESSFGFGDLHKESTKRGLKPAEISKMFNAFGKFIDTGVRSTITEMENKYRRSPDPSDGTYDPETKTDVQVEHFCLFLKEDAVIPHADSVRLHGYFRTNGGYFVVTRLDWFHQIHR